MKCPKCGYHRQTRDNAFVPATECPACGVVYSKHETNAPAGPVRAASQTPPNLRPSPVDEASLKKARDRVEKRLRKRLEGNAHDERHAQTLKLARRFTEEEIRKRRSIMEETHSDAVEALDELDEENQVSAQEASPVKSSETSPSVESVVDQNSDMDKIVATETETHPLDLEDVVATAEEAAIEALPAAAKVPEDDSDVKTETVILKSSAPTPPEDVPAPTFDSTPLKTVTPMEDAPQPDAATTEADTPAPASENPVSIASLAAFSSLSRRGQGFVNMLTAVAWLILGAGVIGAILSWTTISNVEAGMHIPVPASLSSLPLGLLLGFAYLATGALGFAFFWVSSIINRQLKDIRRLLMLQPGVMKEAEAETAFTDGSDDAEQPNG